MPSADKLSAHTNSDTAPRRAASATSDLFAASVPGQPQSYSLDAAYTAHAENNARARWQPWLWAVLVLLAVNAWLWFNYTDPKQLFGASAEQAPQAPLADNKIMPLSSKVGAAMVLKATEPPPIVTVASTEKTACMLWEFSSNADVKKADNRLAEQAWSGYAAELADEPSTYMVFVGPFDKRSDLDAKLKVLDKMKLKDYSALPSAIVSLGVLSTEAAAQTLQASLSKRGLTGVQTSERSGSAQRTRYRFDSMSAESLKALGLLATNLGALRACS